MDPADGTAPAWVGTTREFRFLAGICRAVLVLNAVDAVLTLVWISSGRAVEANPFLRDLVRGNPIVFVCVKTLLVSLGVTLLWRHRHRPLAVVSTFVAFLVYFGVFLYHLHSMHLELFHRIFG